MEPSQTKHSISAPSMISKISCNKRLSMWSVLFLKWERKTQLTWSLDSQRWESMFRLLMTLRNLFPSLFGVRICVINATFKSEMSWLLKQLDAASIKVNLWTQELITLSSLSKTRSLTTHKLKRLLLGTQRFKLRMVVTVNHSLPVSNLWPSDNKEMVETSTRKSLISRNRAIWIWFVKSARLCKIPTMLIKATFSSWMDICQELKMMRESTTQLAKAKNAWRRLLKNREATDVRLVTKLSQISTQLTCFQLRFQTLLSPSTSTLLETKAHL